MEAISVFDIFKVGVGPSSSHTMGPWRAAQQFLGTCRELGIFDRITRVRVDLFGSLAKTGRGHGTDLAVILGLAGEDPVACDTSTLHAQVASIRSNRMMRLEGSKAVAYEPSADLVFHTTVTLPFHPNGLTFTAFLGDGTQHSETYYSVGGGFVVQEGAAASGASAVELPRSIRTAADLLRHCRETGGTIAEVVFENEQVWRSPEEIREGLLSIWRVMQRCVYRGCHVGGILPGGLEVVRRAERMSRTLLGNDAPSDVISWLETIRERSWSFRETLKWVSTFALAVNEENAAFGRVVTAPTNGAAGVIPAVLMYYALLCETRPRLGNRRLPADGRRRSAACSRKVRHDLRRDGRLPGRDRRLQRDGRLGPLPGTREARPDQVLMAAEIAMEHHLGLTCDPVGGLVQVPCIERNTMGAVKAITAANLALSGDPQQAKVSLDAAIQSMWATAQDMNAKYKETSEGGLAVLIPVNLSEC